MQLLDIAASVLATPGVTEPCASFWTESERALLVTLRKRLVLTACAPAEEFIWVRDTHTGAPANLPNHESVSLH